MRMVSLIVRVSEVKVAEENDECWRCIGGNRCARKRGYRFNKDKFDSYDESASMPVTGGQLEFEMNHLLKKLEKRDPERYAKLLEETSIEIHPLFKRIEGDIEEWEIV